ncbi:MAG: hypothetical protein WKG00_14885 [Polyangiaceae bacterium]
MAEDDSGQSERSSRSGDDPSGDDVDAGWDDGVVELGDEELIEEAPSTKTVDSLEMRRLASKRSGPPPAAATSPREAGQGSSAPPPRAELMATVPPPVPTAEYVAQMMDGHDDDAPESGLRTPPRYPKLPSIAERHRAILETLYEEDPLRFDFDDVSAGPRSAPPPISAPAPSSAPWIETEDVSSDDLDPELLKDTPVPQHPPGGGDLDELDELPVEQMLAGLSLPAQRKVAPGIFARRGEAHVPTMNEFPPLPGALGAPVAAPAAAPTGGDAHERATLPGFDPDDPIDLLHDRFVAGDYDGALTLAEGILEVEPGHVEAQRYAESCRDMLRQMYLCRVGGGEQVPRVVMSPEQLRWLTLDHRSGFLLSCVDGQSSIDEILDVCGMPGLDAVRILFDLFEKGVVEMRTH